MAATTLVRARVKTERVRKVSRILDRMGLKPADVVNMVFAQIEQRRALPFDVADAGDDYAFEEYGVTPAEMARFEKRLAKDIARERKAGTIRELKSWRDLRG
jgi:antitoxin component of RelBE/YafQ-DinJ toxin-antitoxin module